MEQALKKDPSTCPHYFLSATPRQCSKCGWDFAANGDPPDLDTPPAPSGAGAEIEAVADIAELVERLRGYVGSEFDNEAHLSGAEVEEVASSLATLQAEVERLTKERDEARKATIAIERGLFRTRKRLHSELAQLKQQLAEKPDDRHFEILCEAMAEIKATSDGGSTQPISDIVAGCLAEIEALPDARRTLSPSEREAGE